MDKVWCIYMMKYYSNENISPESQKQIDKRSPLYRSHYMITFTYSSNQAKLSLVTEVRTVVRLPWENNDWDWVWRVVRGNRNVLFAFENVITQLCSLCKNLFSYTLKICSWM